MPAPGLSSSSNVEERSDERWRAYKMYVSGMSLREVAAHFECSHSTIQKWVRIIHQSAGPHPLVQDYIARQLTEVEIAREQLLRVLVQGGTDDVTVVQATAALMKLHEGERTLIGFKPESSPAEQVRRMSDEELRERIESFYQKRGEGTPETLSRLALPAAGGSSGGE